MKRIGKFVLRVASLALALMLAWTAYPYVRDFALRVFGDIDYDRSARLISHEMEKLGEMTSLRLTDEGVMDAAVDALLVGKVASISAAYRYEIGFGVDLSAAVVSRAGEGIAVALPEAVMLYDSFEVTDAPKIKDFFSLVTEKKYQALLSEQARECRAKYVEDASVIEQAWEAACDALKTLFRQWTGEPVDCAFTPLTE